jgi:hypothetical protein
MEPWSNDIATTANRHIFSLWLESRCRFKLHLK